MRKTIPAHSVIFDYWKDKYINIKSFDVHTYSDECNSSDYISVVDIWEEPNCWACNLPVKDGDNEKHLSKIWNHAGVRSKLQRCHITPNSITKNNEPENIFLMCKRCHKESPDSIYKKMFFRWVVNKRKSCAWGYDLKFFEREINKGIEDFDLDMSHLRKASCEIFSNPEELSKCINTHGFELMYSTIIAALLNKAVEIKNQEHE